MLFILIGVLVACLIGTIIYRVYVIKRFDRNYCDGNDVLLISISILIVLTVFIGGLCLSYNYIDYTSAENKIIIVEESNAELENEVADSIKQYMEYEDKELNALKSNWDNAELIAFAESYPELQSSKLIQEQIITYKENKKEIVELKKAQENDKQTIKFWTFINVN